MVSRYNYYQKLENNKAAFWLFLMSNYNKSSLTPLYAAGTFHIVYLIFYNLQHHLQQHLWYVLCSNSLFRVRNFFEHTKTNRWYRAYRYRAALIMIHYYNVPATLWDINMQWPLASGSCYNILCNYLVNTNSLILVLLQNCNDKVI